MAENLKLKTKIGLYWKFFEQFANYFMQFVIGIIMARLLTPDDFGTAALPAVFMAIAQVFIDSGFTLALIRKDEVTDKDLSTSFYYSLFIGIILYLLIFILAPYIANFYNKPILTTLIRVSSLTFLWSPLNTPQTVILQRKLDFKTPATISIINKLISGVLGIIIAYLGYGIWALVVASLSSNILGVFQTWLHVKWIPNKTFSQTSFKYLWSYGNKMTATRILTTVYANIVPIFLGKYSGTADLGKYNRAVQFASLPSSNLTGVLNSVTFPVLSKLQHDKDVLSINYRRIIKDTSFVVFPVMTLLCVLSKPIILLLITDKWSDCIILLQIMCFTYMFQPVQILNLNLLQILGRTDLSLKLEVIKKILFPVALIYAVQYGLLALCITDFFITMIALVINTFYTGKLIKCGYIQQVRDFMPSLLLSIIIIFPIWFVNSYINSNFLQITIGCLLGGGLYIGMAYLLNFEELSDVKYMLERNKQSE